MSFNSDPAIDERLERGLRWLSEVHGVHVSNRQAQQLVHYLELLVKWSRVYNLTAVRRVVDMVDWHLLDSLVVARWLPTPNPASLTGLDSEHRCDLEWPQQQQPSDEKHKIVDVGSGAGLPVLALAIIRPDLSFVSVESNNKKTRFQHQVALELELFNVEIRNKRVEQISAAAQLVVSRAFTNPENFLRIATTLCARDARVIVMLGHKERLPDPLPKGYQLEQLQSINIPGGHRQRHVAVCRRI